MGAFSYSVHQGNRFPGLWWSLVSAVIFVAGGWNYVHDGTGDDAAVLNSATSPRPDLRTAATSESIISVGTTALDDDDQIDLKVAADGAIDLYGKVLMQADYPDSDSRLLDAPYAHFQQADFSRANLHSANFYHAFLGDAKFNGALLMYATLRVANLRHSEFLDADLSFSDLGDSESTGAVFNGAVLRHADASRSNMIGARFEYANMYAINLQQSWLLKASLHGAVLADARLDRANLQHVDFTHADLSGANLSGADLRYSNITEQQLASACGSKETVLPESLQNYTMRACP